MKKLLMAGAIIISIVSCKNNEQKKLTGREIFIKNIEARGGEENMRKIKTFYSVRDSKIDGKEFCKTYVYIKYPDKYALKYQYPERVAWIRYNKGKSVEITPEGIKETAQDEQEHLQQEAFIFPGLYWLDNGYNFDLIDEDANSYKIKISKNTFQTTFI